MDRYVVIGNPVSHSKSPIIHARFAAQTGQALEYSTLLAPRDGFAATAQAFFAAGGKGANITVPFKEEAFVLAQVLSPQAEVAGAVNTLALSNGVLHGHNTDGIGLVNDIRNNHGGSLAGKSLLVLGAGGATRGILQPLFQEGAAAITIANRTVDKARALAKLFGAVARNDGLAVVPEACGFQDLAGRSFDWVINATSASLQGEVPPIPPGVVTGATWCYDLMYASEPTAFCRWAQANGAGRVMDGLGMLVEQAAEAFFIWRGVRPLTGKVIALLRNDG